MLQRIFIIGLSSIILAVLAMGCESESSKAPETAAAADQTDQTAKTAESSLTTEMKNAEAEAEAVADADALVDTVAEAVNTATTEVTEAAKATTEEATEAALAVKDEAKKILGGDMNVSEEAAKPQAEATPVAENIGLTMSSLANHVFILTKVNGVEYSGEQMPLIEFSENSMVFGKICNNFNGHAKLTDETLTISPIASTRMMCPQTELNQMEHQFFEMLEKGATITMDGTNLIFKQGGNTFIFKAGTPAATKEEKTNY